MAVAVASKADPYGRDIPSRLPAPPRTGGPETGAGEYLPPWLKPIRVNERDVLQRLRAHLDANEPRVIRWLYSTWNANRGVLDEPRYQEIRNALIGRTPGGARIPQEAIEVWREQYVEFVNDRLRPRWEAAIERGWEGASGRIGSVTGQPFARTPVGALIDDWLTQRGGELAVELTEAQVSAVRATIRYYTVAEPLSPQELGRVLRPMIGLTETEAGYVAKLRTRLAGDGLTGVRLNKRVEDYAAFLHRRRAERIARTELATAYNHGQYAAVRHAEELGAFGRYRTEKVWDAAEDERTCSVCGTLDGQRIGLNETYPTAMDDGAGGRQTSFTPPAHPNCRCAVAYELLE